MKELIESQKSKQNTVRHGLMEQLQIVLGIWVNGKCYFLHNSAEKVIYEEGLILRIKPEQVHSKIRFFSVYISNHSNVKKDIKVIVMHHFSNVNTDSLTFISPAESKIFHAHDHKVFLVNGNFNGAGLSEYTTIPLWSAYTDQIWSSLENGALRYQPMAKGPAASIFTVKMSLGSRETQKMNAWAISGSSKKELILMEQALLKNPLAFPNEK